MLIIFLPVIERKSVMKTKFNIGDEIYSVLEGRVEEKCDLCNGEGTLHLKDGRDVECPRCLSTGKKMSNELFKIEIFKFKVGAIQISKDHIVYIEESDSMNPRYCTEEFAFSKEEDAKKLINKPSEDEVNV